VSLDKSEADLHENGPESSKFAYYCESFSEIESIFFFFLDVKQNMLNNLILINEYDLQAYAENDGKLHLHNLHRFLPMQFASKAIER
jgi:hypothetical protein